MQEGYTRDVLDHGYVRFIESWGSDKRIIEAARMSVDKGFIGWEDRWKCRVCDCMWFKTEDNYILYNDSQTPGECCLNKDFKHERGDEGLLNYLYTNRHTTPFEMAGLIIEIQAPIMVFREWHRHRTQSYNEMSARYTPLPDVNYMPTLERCLEVNTTNKQASAIKDSEVLTHESALEWLGELADLYEHCQAVYQSGLQRGIAKELARLPVPVGRYSRMRASANLKNWLDFLTLRLDTKAQKEIRLCAGVVGSFIKHLYPKTWDKYNASKNFSVEDVSEL
jgi:thymidylate synthase (FAD)